jgi:hypothetical protein
MKALASSKRAGSRTGGILAGALAFACLAVLLICPGCSSLQGIAQGIAGASSASASSSTASGGGTGGALLLGVMVHLEGWRNEANNPAMFRRHVGLVRQYAAIFEKYGLRLTLEASPEFTRACAAWKDSVLKELFDRGHGVGVHADLGAEHGLTRQAFTDGLIRMKSDIESLGIEVRHVSGICSSLDWVGAAREAGFEFVSGTVEYALKSIPADKLPVEYHDVLAALTPSEFHGNVPHELSDRLHPWRMSSGADWLWDDPGGKVVILPGDGGTCISWMAEDASGGARARRPVFDTGDVTAFTAEVDRALGLSVGDRVNALYVGWSIGQQADPAIVEAWAKACKDYVDAGKVQWKTLPQMYDAFLAWESDK